ncbi:hybrid sensor histidine kinase/response regulator [Egbenema bharatensis]|uniref:hybrid sensor histidine kinase/response regulator n=1 Tax=Egbenema bharatensis TaxID=3463334 RepID=UPI003A86FA7B
MTNQVNANIEPPQAVQILVVEDESIIARDIKDCLENLGYEVPAIATTGSEAINQATHLNPDLILMDIRLKGDMDGIQAAEQIWNRLQIPIVYATGFSDRPTLERAKLTRPFGYILKPIEERELYAAVETALHQYRANRDLQDREQWLSTVLRDIGDGVIVVDTQLKVCLMNLVAEALTGWRQNEAAGRNISEVFQVVHEHTQTELPNPVVAAIEQGRAANLPSNALLIPRDSVAIPIADTATPIRDGTGEITGAVVVFHDVTRRRLAEERELALQRAQQLETQMREIERLNQLKDDFLNTVSHELRTPLANMKMSIQMLEIVLSQGGVLQGEDSSARRTVKYLEILREQCNQELILVNDLLDLQRLNADTYSLAFSAITLQDWIPHIVENFQLRIQAGQQQLEMDIPESLPTLTSDMASLTRIVSELLNNACKYTPANEKITITVRLQPIQSIAAGNLKLPPEFSVPGVQISVCNSGVEIPEEALSQIFEPFYRIPNSDLRNQGGTGLGLALIRKLVDYLNGRITVESASRQTCFRIHLPITPLNAEPAP